MARLPLRYAFQDWKEETLIERPDGVKLTRVDAVFSYEGEFAGTTNVFYLMQYFADGTGSYDGWERFVGTLGGSPGEVMLRHEGRFDPKGVDVRVAFVDGTGTGSLAGKNARFTARFEDHGPYPVDLELD